VTFVVETRSRLRAPADVVWAHATRMEGVNAELAPWVRMSVPAAVRGRSITDVTLGAEAFPSWLLFLGLLPFDRHHLTLVERGERSFVEESWSWMQRRWRHERTVTAVEGGCEVVDRVTVEPRLAPSALVRPLVTRIFAGRHRVVRERFGALG
jgi:ligand-binding SRPBCC domain-containing protein